MADKKGAETKQASNMLLQCLNTRNPPSPPFLASFKHCRQWGEGGIAVFYTKTLLNVMLVDKQLMHVLCVHNSHFSLSLTFYYMHTSTTKE
eukprot:15299417-Ditylum_brightwellii.AAC.1